MLRLTIDIPDQKANLVKQLLKELGVTIKEGNVKDESPNKETIAAMEELKAGKGRKFDDTEALFDSI